MLRGERRRMKQLLAEGLSKAEVARRLGCTRQTRAYDTTLDRSSGGHRHRFPRRPARSLRSSVANRSPSALRSLSSTRQACRIPTTATSRATARSYVIRYLYRYDCIPSRTPSAVSHVATQQPQGLFVQTGHQLRKLLICGIDGGIIVRYLVAGLRRNEDVAKGTHATSSTL